jgi:hypothetical protein
LERRKTKARQKQKFVRKYGRESLIRISELSIYREKRKNSQFSTIETAKASPLFLPTDSPSVHTENMSFEFETGTGTIHVGGDVLEELAGIIRELYNKVKSFHFLSTKQLFFFWQRLLFFGGFCVPLHLKID